MTELLAAALTIACLLFFPIPFFARRFGKFLPADAGTALVRSFHVPRFAKPRSAARAKRRKALWLLLIRGGFWWGIIGAVFLYFLLPQGLLDQSLCLH